MTSNEYQAVFTSMRIQNKHIYNLDLHLQRLKVSSQIIGIPHNLNEENLRQEIHTICQAAIHDQKLKIITNGTTYKCISSELKNNIHTSSGAMTEKILKRPYPQAKYATNRYQLIQQEQANNVIETIFIDKNGFILEGNISNIFVIKNSTLITPPNNDCLPGIMRENVLKFAQQNNITVQKKRLHKIEAQTADEILLTNSIKGIMRVTKWSEWHSKSNAMFYKLIMALPFDI